MEQGNPESGGLGGCCPGALQVSVHLVEDLEEVANSDWVDVTHTHAIVVIVDGHSQRVLQVLEIGGREGNDVAFRGYPCDQLGVGGHEDQVGGLLSQEVSKRGSVVGRSIAREGNGLICTTTCLHTVAEFEAVAVGREGHINDSLDSLEENVLLTPYDTHSFRNDVLRNRRVLLSDLHIDSRGVGGRCGGRQYLVRSHSWSLEVYDRSHNLRHDEG